MVFLYFISSLIIGCLFFIGGDLVDEDVDIGENDLPASNFPPVEIEKDTAGRSSKCSSSSSSSSDSGLSSTGMVPIFLSGLYST